jgi:hypothetical protein
VVHMAHSLKMWIPFDENSGLNIKVSFEACD